MYQLYLHQSSLTPRSTRLYAAGRQSQCSAEKAGTGPLDGKIVSIARADLGRSAVTGWLANGGPLSRARRIQPAPRHAHEPTPPPPW